MALTWRCPQCRKSTHLWVNALVTVGLSFNDEGELEGSEPVDNNHEWTEDSVAGCDDCQYAGRVSDLNTEAAPASAGAIGTIFVVGPDDFTEQDVLCQVAQTTAALSLDDAYAMDKYEELDSFDNLDDAKQCAAKLGEPNPVVI